MAYTVAEIINIAKVNQYLCANDIDKKGLYGGGVDLGLPRKMYCIRKNVEYWYNLDSTDVSLVPTSNYLYALCSPYNQQAAYILNNNTGGTVAIPNAPVSVKSPIRITSSDFADATNWNGNNSDNISILPTYTLQVFANFVARYLTEGTEWERTSTGINILLSGFDSQTQDYEFYIFISA